MAYDLSAWLNANLPQNSILQGICGVGGMGVVFRVHRLDWDIVMAVKVPKPSKTRPIENVAIGECELWADIGLHPYVATLFYTSMIDGQLCTFSEFVENGGLDVALRCKKHLGIDDETSLSRILTICASTAWGLEAAHQSELVHCDFKPGNVLVQPDFSAKVTDFGLARRNQHGSFKCPGGTPLYASPEQARGEDLTSATDFWSWAATCFEMFVGEASWHSGAAVRAAFFEFLQNGKKAPRFPSMPDSLVEILELCLSTEPRDRPRSFSEIAKAICAIHSNLLDEPCPASQPDLKLVAADSLNNRAVCLLDLGEQSRAKLLLQEALKNDPYHPEALFNYHTIIRGGNAQALSEAEKMLQESAALDSANHIPFVLLAKLSRFLGRHEDANRFQRFAAERSGLQLSSEVIHGKQRLAPVLAKPMSGDELAFHKERFYRLIAKAQTALTIHDFENANRYVLMAGDIPGFARHPDLYKLRRTLSS